jgi:hypothetical protein
MAGTKVPAGYSDWANPGRIECRSNSKCLWVVYVPSRKLWPEGSPAWVRKSWIGTRQTFKNEIRLLSHS